MRAALRFRLRLLSVAIILFALLLILRLYFVQVVHGEEFALKAERQYTKSATALYDRGSIYFTRKDGTHLSAAGVSTGFKLALTPDLLEDPDGAYALISANLAVDEAEFREAAGKIGDPYESIATHVPEAAGQAIADAELPGVVVERDRWRTYPAGVSAAQSIGFVAFDNDDSLAGRYGLERYYDDVLSRRSEGLFGNFFAELFANLNSVTGDGRDAREGDLITTLEPVVSEKLRQVLLETNAHYGSLETSGIIMNPKTGEIIALDSVPSYDPNDVAGSNPEHFGNPLVEHRHEFGSIVKALTMASGLDAGVITPSTTYSDTGCITLNTKKICNHDLKARGTASMQDILSQSLNLGVSFISQRLGHEKMRTYIEKLGLGTETGIDLPSEIPGDIENIKDSPRDVEYATAAFGQGIASTPVEMIRALGALANEGMIVTPHLVKAIRLESGIVKELSWGDSERVYSPEAVEKTTRMLVHVVDNDLAGGTAGIPEMSIAAKTGTAQVSDAGGGYSSYRYFHSFFGYFPAYEPEFIILLYTREPQGVRYASETLTEPFMELTKFLISYYDLPPDRAEALPE